MVIRYNMKERQGITFIQKKGEFTNEFNFISDSIDSTDCDRAAHRTAVRRIRESTTGYGVHYFRCQEEVQGGHRKSEHSHSALSPVLNHFFCVFQYIITQGVSQTVNL